MSITYCEANQVINFNDNDDKYNTFTATHVRG